MKVIVCKGCGERMMGVDEKGKAACPICIGINPDSGVPLEVEMPDTVRCRYCRQEVRTTQQLPFLNSKTATYYCGCRGWD